MEITKESAQLIVEIYKNINSLRHIFNKKQYIRIKELIEGGETLSAMMNTAIDGEYGNSIKSNLPEIITCVESLICHSENFQKISIDFQLRQELNQLLLNLSKLKSKF